jgi:hypothetical protein
VARHVGANAGGNNASATAADRYLLPCIIMLTVIGAADVLIPNSRIFTDPVIIMR